MFCSLEEPHLPAIRLIIAEPQHIFLQGLLHDLRAAKDIKVVATANTGREAITLIREHQPDVALVAIQLPDVSGLVVLDELADEHKILFLTNEENRDIILEAMMMGARGYLLKWSPDLRINNAIRLVASGGRSMDGFALNSFIEAVQDALSRDGAKIALPLTFRERQILDLLAKGLSQQRAAKVLNLSPSTVKSHCRNIYAKLDVRNQTSAVVEAQRRGYI